MSIVNIKDIEDQLQQVTNAIEKLKETDVTPLQWSVNDDDVAVKCWKAEDVRLAVNELLIVATTYANHVGEGMKATVNARRADRERFKAWCIEADNIVGGDV